MNFWSLFSSLGGSPRLGPFGFLKRRAPGVGVILLVKINRRHFMFEKVGRGDTLIFTATFIAKMRVHLQEV